MMDTLELFNYLIYQSNRKIIRDIVDKYKHVDSSLDEKKLVEKFLNKTTSIVNDIPIKKKRGRPPKNKDKKLLIIT